MSTTISVLGGIGLFLLGMTVMTDGLKSLAGSALRTVLGKAAATPLSGAFWGAIVTLLVQSGPSTLRCSHAWPGQNTPERFAEDDAADKGQSYPGHEVD